MTHPIILTTFPPFWHIPNASPPCMKLECYLRMAGISYTSKHVLNPTNGPKHKLPFIVYQNESIGDSGLIIQWLEQQHQIDVHLNSKQQATSLALQHLMEDCCYWSMVWGRWIDPAGIPEWKKACFNNPCSQNKPRLLKALLYRVLTKSARKQLYAVGMGRHQKDAIYRFAIQSLDAASALLDEQDFIFGTEPHIIDATVYAQVANFMAQPWQTPIITHLRENAPRLMAHSRRMQQRYFPEIKEPL